VEIAVAVPVASCRGRLPHEACRGDEREYEVELLLDRQAPVVLEGRRLLEELAIRLPRHQQVPVLDICQRRQGVATEVFALSRCPAERGDHDRQTEPGERGREQSASSPQPEGSNRPTLRRSPAFEEKCGDEEARQGEECAYPQEAAGERHTGVKEEHRCQRQRPEAIECGEIRDRSLAYLGRRLRSNHTTTSTVGPAPGPRSPTSQSSKEETTATTPAHGGARPPREPDRAR